MAVAGRARPRMQSQVGPSVTHRMPVVQAPQQTKSTAPKSVT